MIESACLQVTALDETEAGGMKQKHGVWGHIPINQQ